MITNFTLLYMFMCVAARFSKAPLLCTVFFSINFKSHMHEDLFYMAGIFTSIESTMYLCWIPSMIYEN